MQQRHAVPTKAHEAGYRFNMWRRTACCTVYAPASTCKYTSVTHSHNIANHTVHALHLVGTHNDHFARQHKRGHHRRVNRDWILHGHRPTFASTHRCIIRHTPRHITTYPASTRWDPRITIRAPARLRLQQVTAHGSSRRTRNYTLTGVAALKATEPYQ